MKFPRWMAVAGVFLLMALLYFTSRWSSGNVVPELSNELGRYLILQVAPQKLDELTNAIQPIQDKYRIQLITGEAETFPWELKLPAGALPVIAIVSGRKDRAPSHTGGPPQTSRPYYHTDFDPLKESRVPFPGLAADSLLQNFNKIAGDYFVSDGNPAIFSFPEKEKPHLDRFRLPSKARIHWLRSTTTFAEESLPDRQKELAEKKTSQKGLYITAGTAQRSAFFKQLRERAKSAGLDTLVIDVKSFLARPYLDLARQHLLMETATAEASPWLRQLVETLHAEGFRISGRIVVFKEDHLVMARPDLGVMSSATGDVWRDRKGGRWADPYSDEVGHYNYLIALAAAASGIDEIQFDYIRFPTDGSIASLRYPHADDRSHVKVIMDFLRKVREGIAPYGTSLALDIFGVTAWQNRIDIEHLGQDLRQLSHYLDVISPMLYPSHFHRGYDGFENPGSHPYYFMHMGVMKGRELLQGLPVKIVPWIQGFNLRSPNFGGGYIKEQIRAIQDAGLSDYLIWNARNVYDISLSGVRAR